MAMNHPFVREHCCTHTDPLILHNLILTLKFHMVLAWPYMAITSAWCHKKEDKRGFIMMGIELNKLFQCTGKKKSYFQFSFLLECTTYCVCVHYCLCVQCISRTIWYVPAWVHATCQHVFLSHYHRKFHQLLTFKCK